MSNEAMRLLYEIRHVHGAKNVDGIKFSRVIGKWLMTFKKGDDMTFDTFEDVMKWIEEENAQD